VTLSLIFSSSKDEKKQLNLSIFPNIKTTKKTKETMNIHSRDYIRNVQFFCLYRTWDTKKELTSTTTMASSSILANKKRM
jgi:hypothetical protein